MLGARYRIICFNNSGTSSNASAGTTTVKRKGWYIDSTGKPIWEASPTTIFSNAGAITTGSYDTSDATSVDNAGATNPYIGAEFEFKFTATGSPTGLVTFFLQRSTDGGTTWPDNGQGEVLCTIAPTAAAAYVSTTEYD